MLEKRVFQMYGFNAEAPELKPFSGMEDTSYLTEAYAPGTFSDGKLFFNEKLLDSDDLRDHIDEWTDRLGEVTLQELFREEATFTAEGLGVDIDRSLEARFAPVNGKAAFSWVDNVMSHGFQGRGDLSPCDEPQVTATDIGYSIRHEAAHAVQSENPEFKDLMVLPLTATETQEEFSAHPDNAGIEALPRFEEDPEGTTRHSQIARRTGDRWKLPDALTEQYTVKGERRINGGGGHELGENLYSGPYAMAEVIAFTVKNHFDRKEHIDDSIQETERALFDIVADAARWEDMLEGIWNDWGVPNYHELFRRNYARIRNDPSYAKSEMNRLESELIDQEEEDIELYYQATAFVHAYRESGREEVSDLENIEHYAEKYARADTGLDSVLGDLEKNMGERPDITEERAS